MRSTTQRASFALICGLLAVACDPPTAPLDLSSHGVAATLDAPEGATVAAAPVSGVMISADGFALLVSEGAQDVAGRHEEYASRENFEILRHDANVVSMEQTAIGGPFGTFLANVEVGGTTLGCREDPRGRFDTDEMERMLEACLSLRTP